ncbi:MAG TPA: DnaD domain protein [Clostridium sp.]|nr:DnaD domain protein [Clostridium sp.]
MERVLGEITIVKKKLKKYYWLKLKEDFFEQDTIEWLEEQENGVYYSNFYLKLCLRSLKTDGILIRNVGEILIPYDIKKLAEITRVKIDTAIVAMELFKKIGLVQILDNGEIYLTQLELMVGSETSNAALMRERRKNNKLKNLQPNNNVNTMLENCYTEKETDIELDTDINKDTHQETELKSQKANNRNSKRDKKKKKSSSSFLSEISVSVIEEKEYDNTQKYSKNINNDVNADLEVYKHFEKCGFNVSSRLMEFIAEDINVYGRKWVIEAANECVRKGKSNNYGYLTGILQNWSRNGHMDNSNGEIKANTSAYTPMTSILDE